LIGVGLDDGVPKPSAKNLMIEVRVLRRYRVLPVGESILGVENWQRTVLRNCLDVVAARAIGRQEAHH
jgi:hypothetical protein